jgi:hypothetical protein
LIAYLFTGGEKELVWIHAVGNSTSNERKPVKYHRWFIALIEELLVDQIDHHRDEGNGSNIAGDTKDLANEQWHQLLHDAFAMDDDRGEQQKYTMYTPEIKSGGRN